MKKIFLLGLAVVVLGSCVIAGIVGVGALTGEKGQVCLSQHQDNLIGCLLAPPLALTVKVSASVDEVMILRAGDDLVVGRIATNGRDVTDTIQLSTAYRYYLVLRKGDQTRTGQPQGFSTFQGSAQLEIFAIDHWEGPR